MAAKDACLIDTPRPAPTMLASAALVPSIPEGSGSCGPNRQGRNLWLGSPHCETYVMRLSVGPSWGWLFLLSFV